MDISKIDDVPTRKFVTQICKNLDEIEIVFNRFGIDGEIKKLSKDKLKFIQIIAKSDIKNLEILDLKYEKFCSLIQADLKQLSTIAHNKLQSQFKKQNFSISKIEKKYNISPSSISEMKTQVDVIRFHRNIVNASQDTRNIQNYFSNLHSSLIAFAKCVDDALIDIWKSIQELEKYHNDNGRYQYARIAFFVSMLSLLGSVLTIGFQQYNYWTFGRNSDAAILHLLEESKLLSDKNIKLLEDLSGK